MPSSLPVRSDGSQVKVVTAKGGEVAFDMANDKCSFISASPKAGFKSQIVSVEFWIRVDLVDGEGHGTAVYCTWHTGRPMVDAWPY